MSLRWGGGWDGGRWDAALQNLYLSHEQPNRPYQLRVILSCKPHKMLLNQFLTSISDVFNQLATRQLAPGPFKEHPGARGRQIGHRNKPWEKQTKEE